MTRSKEQIDDVIIAPNKALLSRKRKGFSSEIFVIGGEYIYKEFRNGFGDASQKLI